VDTEEVDSEDAELEEEEEQEEELEEDEELDKEDDPDSICCCNFIKSSFRSISVIERLRLLSLGSSGKDKFDKEDVLDGVGFFLFCRSNGAVTYRCTTIPCIFTKWTKINI